MRVSRRLVARFIVTVFLAGMMALPSLAGDQEMLTLTRRITIKKFNRRNCRNSRAPTSLLAVMRRPGRTAGDEGRNDARRPLRADPGRAASTSFR